jgi:hypothetical protein
VVDAAEPAGDEPGRRRGVGFGVLGVRPLPAGVDGGHPQLEPAVEVLVAEGLALVHLAVRLEQRAAVAALAEQDPAPVVDQARDVHGPVGLGDLLEQRAQEVVEHDLAVERDDQVVDRRP